MDNLYLALIHYPVINKTKDTIGSALTTIDLHDIARASMTYGVKGFYVVTPFEDQKQLANQVIRHWTSGVGGKLNPDRKKALELIRVVGTFEDALLNIGKEENRPVRTIATSAKEIKGSVQMNDLKQELNEEACHVLVFGTAWGLAEEFIEMCDFILEPIRGKSKYNHLSVRSAASIYLDRIFNS